MRKGDWLYDIEIYPNLFLLGAKVPGTNIRVSFQISPFADDRHALIKWLQDDVERMIGFNNLAYDYPMLHLLVTKAFKARGRDLCKYMYEQSKRRVASKNNYGHNYKEMRRQIDMFKINHFDNKARMTSLKLLEFNLRAKILEELPFPFDQVLTQEQIWKVVEYNHNDNDAAELLLKETKNEIILREKMGKKYGIDFMNYNSTKMGEHILIKTITDKLGVESMYDLVPTEYGDFRKVVKNTPRESIDLGEVVFDNIKFKSEPFQAIDKWFRSQVITDTKGVFSKIPVEDVEIIKGHYAESEHKWVPKYKEFREKSTVSKSTKKNPIPKLKTLNVVYKDFRYDFGVGGIHGCIRPGVYKSTATHCIIDIDVKSFYPNLAIVNEFYPEHIGPEFCVIYKGMYLDRGNYSKATHLLENLSIKLGLNGAYGKSNSEYSALYDPKYTMLTTINGQLSLCMLAENLLEKLPDTTMLQINTDGLTIKVPRHLENVVKIICERWEKYTKLELEYAYYEQMIIKDVNNYIGEFTDGGRKRKGATFIHKVKPGELELHKNFSHLVVPKALEAYFINGQDPEEFVRNHDDMYDFFLRTKLAKSYDLEMRIYDENEDIISSKPMQNITRYFVSGKYTYNKDTKLYERSGHGGTLIKIMPPLKGDVDKREENVEKGWLCTEVNNLPDNLNDLLPLIDYDYYIDKVKEVIEIIQFYDNRNAG